MASTEYSVLPSEVTEDIEMSIFSPVSELRGPSWLLDVLDDSPAARRVHRWWQWAALSLGCVSGCASWDQFSDTASRPLRATGDRQSAARFVCALALVRDGRVLFEARGTVEGRISPEPKGHGGFGYDPIFFYPPFGQTLAEAGDAKAAVSHRGEAFGRLRRFLETQNAER